MPDRANRSQYQVLTQVEEADVGDTSDAVPSPSRVTQNTRRPGHIDLTKLDNAFKRSVLRITGSTWQAE